MIRSFGQAYLFDKAIHVSKTSIAENIEELRQEVSNKVSQGTIGIVQENRKRIDAIFIKS